MHPDFALRTPTVAISLAPPSAGHFDSWFALYESYVAERGESIDRRAAGVVWRWLLDGTHRVGGVLALDVRRNVVGFALYHPFPRTRAGSEGCQIDDLYVAESQRAGELTQGLLAWVCETARKRGWHEIRLTCTAIDPSRAYFASIAESIDDAAFRILL